MATRLVTTITEAPMDADEEAMVLFALERSRAQFAWKVGGLDAAGLNTRVGSSSLTLGGLLKHLAFVEDVKSHFVILDQAPPEYWAAHGYDEDWPWESAGDDAPDELYELWQAAVERSRAIVAERLAAGGLDQPVAHTFEGWGTPNLRRILCDLHDEYARHVGHADLLREHVDGLVGEDPPQPELPALIAAFQAAQDARDPEAATALCAPDVVITDDGHTYAGRDGVVEFVRTAAAAFTFTRTLLDAVEEAPGSWIVTNRVAGDFPGSPVDLHSRFRLAGEQIAALDIAP